MAGGLQRTLNGCQGEQIKQPLENRLSLIQVRYYMHTLQLSTFVFQWLQRNQHIAHTYTV